MSNKKKAFIFDTNFIIQNKNLEDVVENLSEVFTVYVTQLSIDERISQQCIELKKKYDDIPMIESKYAGIAKIKINKSFEDIKIEYKNAINKKYKKLFGENIITYTTDEKTFEQVLSRAYQKCPPFSPAEGASDKGFKDCILWLSLIKFFEKNGESEIVFLTDDKSAFRNHVDFLVEEFSKVTGKHIEFKPNSYYKELLKPEVKPQEKNEQKKLPELSEWRERINSVVYNLCVIEEINEWGNEFWERTFVLNQKVDADYMKVIFSGLYNDINNHIFDKYVSAQDIFDLDGRVCNGSVAINISDIEEAYRLHEEIKQKFPDYIEQFYITVANIFNSNYVEPKFDGELPF